MPIPRKVLADSLKPILPPDWAIIPSGRTIDAVPTTTVQLKQLSIIRTPAAPASNHTIEFVVTIAAPEQKTQAAEDRLDDQVVDLLHAFDDLQIAWTEARKVSVTDRRLGYDITLTITSQKEQNNG